ncbi:MAG: hypothetical protein HOK28_24135 [Deltaproteobacteria bacterium]|nr:hypothetical protein [Deltaproteobacteria bacterium]
MPAESLGAILAAGGLNMTPKHDAKVYRFRYTTQDRGQEIEATAMIGFPVGASLGNVPLPLLSYSHVTLGFSDACAGGRNFVYQMAIAGMASQGYVVVASDYIGMTSHGAPSTVTHAYELGEPAAIGAWDALRAGESLITQLEPSITTTKQTVLAGASQGSLSIFFQERFGPYYAPDFDVSAVVGLVPVLDMLKSSDLAVDIYSGNSFYSAVMHTSGHKWYGFDAPLSSLLSNTEPHFFADNAHSVLYDPENCAYESDLHQSMDSIDKIYNPDHVAAILDSGTSSIEHWNCLVRENSILYSSIPTVKKAPTLLYYAENDAMIPPGPYAHAYQAMCDNGVPVEYNICTGAEHSEGIQWSLPETFIWIDKILAGEATGPVCEYKEPHCCAGTPTEVCE